MQKTISRANLVGYCSEASLPAMLQVIEYYRTLKGTDVLHLVRNAPAGPAPADPDQGAEVPAVDALLFGIPCAAPWAIYRCCPLDEAEFWQIYQITERLMNAALADTMPAPGPAMILN